MSYPFWTEYNANHYVNQAVPHSKLQLKEQWTSWDKYRVRITLFAWDTWAEAFLSESPTINHYTLYWYILNQFSLVIEKLEFHLTFHQFNGNPTFTGTQNKTVN